MITPLSLKQKRVHNNFDIKSKPSNSTYVFGQTSYNCIEQKNKYFGKKVLMLQQQPILSFTSFQSYLEDCNQNSFVRKQNQRLFRSQHKHKTQESFNPKKHTCATSQNKKQRFLSQQDNNLISPFQTDKQITFSQYKSVKSNRKAHSKSQSSHYNLQKSSSFAQRFLHQKLCQIEGWNHNEQNFSVNNKGSHNQNYLKQRSYQNRGKNEVKLKVQTKRQIHNIQQPTNSFQKNSSFQQTKKRSVSNSNKQNVSQILPVFKLRKKRPQQYDQLQQSNPFHKTYKKQFILGNCLTQINQLQQQILLSKREDATNRSSNALKTINHQEQSNILRLKKEAQYLCDEQEDFKNIESYKFIDKQNVPTKSKSVSIQLGEITKYSTFKNCKPFVKFPKQDSLKNNNVDTEITQNKVYGSFELKQKSSGVLKMLQSFTPNNQNTHYEPRTPIKPSSNLKNYSRINGADSDMKNASRNKQSFHNSIKQRKSNSAFNSICRNSKNKQIPKINTSQFINSNNEKQEKILLTIVNSFHTVINNRQKNKFNKNNLSLTKSINTSINRDQNQCKRLHTSESFQQEIDEFNTTSYCKDISQFLTDSQQYFPISFGKQQKKQHNFSLYDPPQPLQNLNKLSQEIKKMTKLSTPISLSTKYNKKFSNLHKSIKNDKYSLRSPNIYHQKEQNLQNLCDLQLQVRKIQKLKKLTEIEK